MWSNLSLLPWVRRQIDLVYEIRFISKEEGFRTSRFGKATTRGHLSGLIASAWEREQLFDFMSTYAQDFSFLRSLSIEEIHALGA